MSLHEAEHHHSHAERNRTLDGQQVLTIKQFADLNGFSVFTARRLIKAGKGPVVTQISDRRVGITVANNGAWQRARERV
jgi:hypothetical protein